MKFVLDRVHLKKELRPLLLPWGLAVFAGGLMGLKPLTEGSGLENFLAGLAGQGFLGGLALLAATSFGAEFHERTFTLLLSQPASRAWLWAQKMILLTLAIVSAGVAEALLLKGMSNWYPGDEIAAAVREFLGQRGAVVCGMFLLVTICSSPFWTLLAGSTIGGLVFTVAAQFLLTLAAGLVVARWTGQDELFQDARIFSTLVLVGLIYAMILLYLGRRKFLRLEVRGPNVAPGAALWRIPGWTSLWLGPLASRPKGRVGNLIRKELRLQRSMFQLAGAFLLCWLAVVMVQWFRPKQEITYMLDILTSLYAPVSCLLVACVSLGEEKVLGMTTAQWVLPVSATLQWFIKLVVCATTAAVLSLALPVMLFWVTSPVMNLRGSGLMNQTGDGMEALSIISGLMFVLGYWAGSLTTHTVRAALVAIIGVIVLPVCTVVAMRCAYLGFGLGGFGRNTEQTVLSATAAAGIVLMLGQSLIRFRNPEEHRGKLLFYSVLLVGLVLFVSFWTTCVG